MLQHNHWGRLMDGSLCKILGSRAGEPQDWCTPDTVCRNGAQDSLFSATVLHCYYLPVNVRCLRDSLSVTDSGSHSGTPFEAPFVDFLRYKIYTEFSPATFKENDMLKNLAACHSEALSSRGPYARAYRA